MEDNTRMVLTVDKGVAMVVMERQDYKDKVLSLLSDTSTYKTIPKDPTTMLRNSLINKLRASNKKVDSMTLPTKCYTPLVWSPKFYGLPKIHKTGTPLRHIVSTAGIHHLWGSQGTSRYHLPPGRSVTSSP